MVLDAFALTWTASFFPMRQPFFASALTRVCVDLAAILACMALLLATGGFCLVVFLGNTRTVEVASSSHEKRLQNLKDAFKDAFGSGEAEFDVTRQQETTTTYCCTAVCCRQRGLAPCRCSPLLPLLKVPKVGAVVMFIFRSRSWNSWTVTEFVRNGTLPSTGGGGRGLGESALLRNGRRT